MGGALFLRAPEVPPHPPGGTLRPRAAGECPTFGRARIPSFSPRPVPGPLERILSRRGQPAVPTVRRHSRQAAAHLSLIRAASMCLMLSG